MAGFNLTGMGPLGGALSDLGNAADRLRDRHLRVAITGLRRSGKTVFTTVLAQHLLAGEGMPFVRAVHEGRYLGAQMLSPSGPRFPYQRFLNDLQADPPRWPEPTQELTTLRMEIRFRSKAFLSNFLSPMQRLYLEIVDYPGEWLLDLPLLEETFTEFSERSWALCLHGPRAQPSAPYRAAAELAAVGSSSEPEALAAAWRDFLIVCQRELNLSVIQPGRLVTGDDDALPDWAFAPLPPGFDEESGLARAMARRFDRYKSRVIEPFYRRHFSRFDRQVVLVDLFHVLNAGRHHFDDTRHALEMILESFRYGQSGWWTRLFSPRIDRVLFAASKADHVAANQHPNLKQLLELMIRPARGRARYEGIREEVMALSSLRSTDTVRTEHHGQVLSCVRGRLKSGERETVLFPGEIPPDLPDSKDWDSGRFKFHDFAPRRANVGKPDNHVRLDQAIEFLIGDKLA